jgi:hypothetical protein
MQYPRKGPQRAMTGRWDSPTKSPLAKRHYARNPCHKKYSEKSEMPWQAEEAQGIAVHAELSNHPPAKKADDFALPPTN